MMAQPHESERLQVVTEELLTTQEELRAANEELALRNEELALRNEEFSARTREALALARGVTTERLLLREMVEHAPAAIMVLRGPMLRVEALNPSFARLLGGRDVRGLPIEEALPLVGWASLVVQVWSTRWRDTPNTTGRTRVMVTGPDDARSEAIFEFTIVPTHDDLGSVHGVVVYARDVTAQVAHEAAEQREQLMLMVENSERAALGLYDVETGRLLRASPRYRELIESRPAQGDETRGEGLPAEALLRAAVEHRTPQRVRELRVPSTESGDDAVWDLSLVPLPRPRDPDGPPRLVVASAVEVTEQVRARERADRENHMRGEFLALASHELRSPLAALATYAGLIHAQVERAPTDDAAAVLRRVAGYVETCGAQLHDLERLVGDLIDIARLEGGALDLRRAPVDVARMVSLRVEELRPVLNGRPLRVELPDDGEAPRVLGDEGRLRQVLTNLLLNAVQHAGDAPIEVSVRRDAARAVEVAVRDHGPGVPAAEREAIFERFYRAKHGGRSTEGGLGLGLYLCRKIVEQHGGTIGVEGADGAGSTFVVRLPLAG